jgi:hypothetical protein
MEIGTGRKTLARAGTVNNGDRRRNTRQVSVIQEQKGTFKQTGS